MTVASILLLSLSLLAAPHSPRLAVSQPKSAPAAPGRPRPTRTVVLAALVGIAAMMMVGGLSGVAIGTMLGAAAYVGLRRAANRQRQEQQSDPADLDGLLTVAALMLRSGSPPDRAVADAARVFPVPAAAALERVARLVAMGHPAHRAWQDLADDPALRPIASAAIRSSDSGAALADAWSSVAAQLCADRETRAQVRAGRAGIGVLAPLGLCFLPAFICIGVVPVVVGLAGDIFG